MRHALAKSEPWVAGSTCGRLLVAVTSAFSDEERILVKPEKLVRDL